MTLGGKRCVHLSSYICLGLVADQAVRRMVEQYSARLACGSHAVRMFATGRWHQELEALIARILQSEAAVIFGTDFVTNWAVICKGSGATPFPQS